MNFLFSQAHQHAQDTNRSHMLGPGGSANPAGSTTPGRRSTATGITSYFTAGQSKYIIHTEYTCYSFILSAL